MSDDLTPEEAAAYRAIAFGISRRRRTNTVAVGIGARWSVWPGHWQVFAQLGVIEVTVTFTTRAGYRAYLLALGPYRNA